MPDSTEQTKLIRQFLVGQLPEEQCQELEARIFAEPNFAEEVEIVEEELMRDYATGRLSRETSALFEEKYKHSLANRAELEYEKIFHQFISSKPPTSQRAPDTEPILPLITNPDAGVTLLRRKSRFRAFISKPATLAVAALLLVVLFVGLWTRFKFGPGGIDPALSARRMIEERLQSLNATAFTSGYKLLPVDLRPIERSAGQIPRIPLRTGETDRIIEFHLNIAEEQRERYRALFVDDKRNELFALDDLPVETTQGGQEIKFLIPGEYLKPGDYEIELSYIDGSGNRRLISGYVFRVIEAS